VDRPIKIIGCDAGLDDLRGSVHCLRGDPARDPHFLDNLGRLDIVAGVGIGRRPADVAWPSDAGWHLAWR
jgi:hypothetical protein